MTFLDCGLYKYKCKYGRTRVCLRGESKVYTKKDYDVPDYQYRLTIRIVSYGTDHLMDGHRDYTMTSLM